LAGTERRGQDIRVSKAFTKDEGDASADVIRRAPPSLGPGERRYITPEGEAALARELSSLIEERANVRRTGSNLTAEKTTADLESRISLLQATLDAVTVVVPDARQEGTVYFGAWVEVEDDDGDATTYRLVGPDEVAPREGLISASSPLGRALLGRQVGDTVTVPQPRSPRELTITAIRYALAPTS
jgi:transcription elongation factor GreB